MMFHTFYVLGCFRAGVAFGRADGGGNTGSSSGGGCGDGGGGGGGGVCVWMVCVYMHVCGGLCKYVYVFYTCCYKHLFRCKFAICTVRSVFLKCIFIDYASVQSSFTEQ